MSQSLKVIKSLAVTDSILTATNVTEADYAVWAAGTTYALDARVIKSHKVWQSLQAGNVGQDPLLQPTWWVEVGPTNRWKCLDLSSTTQTALSANSYYEFTPGQAINGVALVNVANIGTVRVRLTDPDFGVVYDQTTSLGGVPTQANWYAWFFDTRVQQTAFVATDLPSYPNAVLRIDLGSGSGGLVGALIIGQVRSMGLGIQQGARLGIQDYSRKERNDWGDTVLVQRAYAKRLQLNTLVPSDELDNVYRTLAEMRASPCLWIASTRYASLTVFGFYQDFEINIQYAAYADCSLTIEGLT